MVEVRILGPLEVVHAGAPVALGGSKQRAVFAMLALRINRGCRWMSWSTA